WSLAPLAPNPLRNRYYQWFKARLRRFLCSLSSVAAQGWLNPGEGAMSHLKPMSPAAGRSIDRGVARRQAFLLVAREVFLEHGFEHASVNDVVRQAGGSLATLYAQFGNKEGLFLAVAEEQHSIFLRDVMPPETVDLPLQEGLQLIGEHLLRALLS